ncbi:MAG TPA: site-2 protease family protein, partial [Candidatus Deferrimicrobiaceae bacterium]|nr:site-2 protease family protein [Candidatus Deferrimicrobiaceae bacterium]
MFDFATFLHRVSVEAIPLVLAITFHEAAHGYVALKKGDPTAHMLGRVTLNPLAHIDPVGTILLPAVLILTGSPFLFGWARPVPVNFRLLRDQKRDPIYVASAGVVTNLMLAAISGILFRIIGFFDPYAVQKVFHQGLSAQPDGTAQMILLPVALMCVASIKWNVLLAIFNLIPVPPLDGGRIAVGLLPYRFATARASVERYGILIVIALFMFDPFGIIRGIIYPLMS